jgi:hypothetical protein
VTAVGVQEARHEEERDALVAVRERMISREMLNEHRCLLDQRGICLNASE